MTEIALNDVRINFGFKEILRGVDFEINTGEKAAIVGGNGSGKTTLFKIIAGKEFCDGGTLALRKGAVIGYLEQDSVFDGEEQTVEEYIKSAQKPVFDLENKMRNLESAMSGECSDGTLDKILKEYSRIQNEFTAMSGYETDENFNRITTAFNFTADRLKQKCGSLSGGQKTVIKLAKILLMAPDILLLDEPTNHIDIGTLDWLEGFIRNYIGTVVIISHDRYFLDRTVKKTILLENGRAETFLGNYSFCLEEQERLTTLALEQYKNQQRMIEAMKDAIKRFREWGERGDNESMFRKAFNMEKRLERLEKIDRPRENETMHISFGYGERSGKRVLTVENLGFAYGNNIIFEGASFELLYKDRAAILGNNGTGKTTLVKLSLGLLPALNGKVNISDSARIGYIEQEIMFPDDNSTILETFQADAKVVENEARRILAKYYIRGEEVYKRIRSLSGGERVKLKLAMLMQKEVNFLLIDEPTNHLDINAREMLEESLLAYKGTILFISHDRYFINKIATRIIEIKDRKCFCKEGNYDDYCQST